MQKLHDFVQKVILNGILFLFMMMPQAHAVVVEDLYAVEIPVVDQNAGTRRAAFNQGLKDVLIRVTGDGSVFSLIKLPRSSSYVKQFQYRELDKQSKASIPEKTGDKSSVKQLVPTQMLWVQFNETKINEFVRNNALPLWGKQRSETVIWLAVNDGVNRYVLKSLDESLLKTVTNESATRRAIPVIWPQVSRKERAIRFADVWAGFQRPLKKLSSVYSNGPIIIGRLEWNGEKWGSDWSLLLDNEKTDWSIKHADYKRLLDEAIDKAADIMGQQYALFDTGDIKSFHSLGIQINNVDSIVALNGLKQYLSTIPMVQRFELERIENNNVFFDMSLRTNTEDFLKTVMDDSKLFLVSDEDQSDAGLKPDVQNKLPQSDVSQRDDVKSDAVNAAGKVAAYQFHFQP